MIPPPGRGPGPGVPVTDDPLPLAPRRADEWTAGAQVAHLARVLAPRTGLALAWWLLVATVLARALEPSGGLCFGMWPFVVPLVSAAGYPIGLALGRGLADRTGLPTRVVAPTALVLAVGIVLGGTWVAERWGPTMATSDRSLVVVLASGFAAMSALIFTWGAD